jgi:hypothetical protein
MGRKPRERQHGAERFAHGWIVFQDENRRHIPVIGTTDMNAKRVKIQYNPKRRELRRWSGV